MLPPFLPIRLLTGEVKVIHSQVSAVQQTDPLFTQRSYSGHIEALHLQEPPRVNLPIANMISSKD